MIRLLFSGFLETIFEIIGIITIPLAFLLLLSNLFPKISRGKKFIYNHLSQHFKFKSLEKQAISSDIEGAINESVNLLQNELPFGWIKKASIKWVEEQSFDELEEGDIILKLKPQANQDSNLVNGIYHFFSSSLFPRTREVIPESTQKAIAIQISKRTIENNRDYVLKNFESEIIEPEVKLTPGILDYLEDFDILDKKGFFTSSFLREIDHLADKIRFSPLRSTFINEIKEITLHNKKFIAAMPEVPDHLWTRSGSISSFRFLLVKSKYKYKYKIYVNRAKMSSDIGIERLYILGSNKERKFVNKVIDKIQKEIKNYKLHEVFNLYRDFRGDKEGIGALFMLNK